MAAALKTHPRLSTYRFGLEAIDFQRDAFGSQLEVIFHDMAKFVKDAGTNNLYQLRVMLQDSEYGALLSDLIYRRLGLRTKFIFKTQSLASVEVMIFNEYHALLNSIWHGDDKGLEDQQKLIKKSQGLVGTVDLKNAKVGGIFSEYVHTVRIDFVGHMYYGTEIPGVVAFLLHECGHAFTYYEMADRLEATNQVMADLSYEIRKGKNTSEKRHYLLKELADKFGLKNDAFDTILEERSNVIFGIKLFQKYIGFVKSQLSNAVYDETASEQLADNFAARFGYGRQLVTALVRFRKYSPERNAETRAIMRFYEVIYCTGASAMVAVSGLVGGIIPAACLLAVIFMVISATPGDATTGMTYDVMKVRYKRIRQQYIEMMQQLELDKEQLRDVVDSVHRIDDIVNNTVIYRSIFNRLVNFIFSSHRKAKDSVELQYLIEELAHNNLFLKSAELEVLS